MFKGVLVFDANNPTDLKLVNQLSTPTRIVYEIQVFNDKLYVADYSGLITYDLSNPEKPERISIFRTDPYKGFRLKIFTK